MDPLSITAAIVVIGAAASATSNAFKELRGIYKNLPGRLHALSNEVADLELVLGEVTALTEKRASDPTFKEREVHIQHLLNQADTKLTELKTILDTITCIVKTAKVPVFRAHAWRKNQPRLQALQKDIKTIKCNLNIMLGTSNSRDMTQIRVDLEKILSVSSSSALNQFHMKANLQTSLVRHRDDLAESLAHHYQQVDQRISGVEDLLKEHTTQLQASQFDQLGTSYGRRPSHSKSAVVSRQPTHHDMEVKSLGDIGMRVARYGACSLGCLADVTYKREAPHLV